MQELGFTTEEFENLPIETQQQLSSKFAKFKGSQLMMWDQIMERDSQRLNRKAEAVYKNLGVKVEPATGVSAIVADDIQAPSKTALMEALGVDDDDDVRIVCDNITIGEQSAKPAPIPKPDPVKPDPQPPKDKSSLVPNLVMSGLTAAAISSGLGLIYLLTRPDLTPPPANTDTQSTIGVLE